MRSCFLVCSVASVLAVAGCATKPIDRARARPVASGRLLPDAILYAHPVPSGAHLVVIRDPARFDVFDRVQMMVDGRAVAILRPAERLDLYVYAGDRILSLVSTPGFLDSPDSAHTFIFKPNHTYYLRVGVFGHSMDVKAAAEPE